MVCKPYLLYIRNPLYGNITTSTNEYCVELCFGIPPLTNVYMKQGSLLRCDVPIPKRAASFSSSVCGHLQISTSCYKNVRVLHLHLQHQNGTAYIRNETIEN